MAITDDDLTQLEEWARSPGRQAMGQAHEAEVVALAVAEVRGLRSRLAKSRRKIEDLRDTRIARCLVAEAQRDALLGALCTLGIDHGTDYRAWCDAIRERLRLDDMRCGDLRAADAVDDAMVKEPTGERDELRAEVKRLRGAVGELGLVSHAPVDILVDAIATLAQDHRDAMQSRARFVMERDAAVHRAEEMTELVVDLLKSLQSQRVTAGREVRDRLAALLEVTP